MSTATHKVEMKDTKASSNVHSIGYDERESTLFIRFRDGMKLYRYEHVPKTAWEAFQRAGSVGTFFQEEIKGYFKYQRVEE